MEIKDIIDIVFHSSDVLAWSALKIEEIYEQSNPIGTFFNVIGGFTQLEFKLILQRKS